MTEAEAKTKWCPFARQMVTIDSPPGNPLQGYSANRFDGNRMSLCIGSGCMAWVETHVRRTWLVQAKGPHASWEEWMWDPKSRKEYEHLPVKPGIVEPHGRCGLVTGDPRK